MTNPLYGFGYASLENHFYRHGGKTITPKECTIDQLWGFLNNYKFDYVCSQLRRAVLIELINRIIKSNSQEVRNDRNEN